MAGLLEQWWNVSYCFQLLPSARELLVLHLTSGVNLTKLNKEKTESLKRNGSASGLAFFIFWQRLICLQPSHNFPFIFLFLGV